MVSIGGQSRTNVLQTIAGSKLTVERSADNLEERPSELFVQPTIGSKLFLLIVIVSPT